MRAYTHYITLIILMLMQAGCYIPVTGAIIDAETREPVAGAVVHVAWTKTRGFGFTYTESYKTVDAISDINGKFSLPGCFCFGSNEPDITIYKRGYIAWSNNYIYPNYSKRRNFTWGYNDYEMYKVPPIFSHSKHMDFVDMSYRPWSENQCKLMTDALEWERHEAYKERNGPIIIRQEDLDRAMREGRRRKDSSSNNPIK